MLTPHHLKSFFSPFVYTPAYTCSYILTNEHDPHHCHDLNTVTLKDGDHFFRIALEPNNVTSVSRVRMETRSMRARKVTNSDIRQTTLKTEQTTRMANDAIASGFPDALSTLILVQQEKTREKWRTKKHAGRLTQNNTLGTLDMMFSYRQVFLQV